MKGSLQKGRLPAIRILAWRPAGGRYGSRGGRRENMGVYVKEARTGKPETSVFEED